MTREEAITLIKAALKTMYLPKSKEYISDLGYALEMAIKALETLEEFEKAQIITDGRLNGRTYAYKCGLEDGKRKALEQEPCEDAITRIFKRMWNCRGKHTTSIDKVKMEQIIRDELPPVTPQPKTGHWITTRTLMHDGEYYCDKCDCDSPHNKKWSYCPNCGARMESEEQE